MSAAVYSVVTARRASDLIYEIALQVPKGIWIVPDNVCPAVPLALACAGAQLRFGDIDAKTLCLDTSKVAELAKTEEIAGVVYVRTYGTDASADNDLADLRKTLPDAILIDDCCIGVPQTRLPETDNVADVIVLSTGYGKVLDLGGGAYGFFKNEMGFISGGRTLAAQAFENLLAQSSAAIKSGAPVFADFDFSAQELSTKNNPPSRGWFELSQSIKTQLPERRAHTAELNVIYAQGLAKYSALTEGYQNWRFHIFVQNQEQTLEALFKAGLFASNHYAPVSKLWGIQSSPVSQKIAKNIINLFNDQHFTAKQAVQAVDIVSKIGMPLVP